jgi:hypothetical protein
LRLIRTGHLALAAAPDGRVASPLWAISIGRVVAAATLATAGLLALAVSFGRLLATAF